MTRQEIVRTEVSKLNKLMMEDPALLADVAAMLMDMSETSRQLHGEHAITAHYCAAKDAIAIALEDLAIARSRYKIDNA